MQLPSNILALLQSEVAQYRYAGIPARLEQTAADLKLAGIPVRLGDTQSLKNYLLAANNSSGDEVRVLLFDRSGSKIGDHLRWQGMIGETGRHTSHIIQYALARNAACLMLIARRWSRDPAANEDDAEAFLGLAAACQPYGLVVHDQINLARTTYSSLRQITDHHMTVGALVEGG